MKVHIRALFADACAPPTSPAWSFPLTWAAYTIATMPAGRQHSTVAKMAGIK
jgi:hypothetical protein